MTPRTVGDAVQHLLEQHGANPGELAEVDAALAEDGATCVVVAETAGGAVLASCFDVPPGSRFRPREIEQRVELALHFARALA